MGGTQDKTTFQKKCPRGLCKMTAEPKRSLKAHRSEHMRGPHAASQPTWGFPHRWQPHSSDGWRPQEKTSKGTLPAKSKAKAPCHDAGPAQGKALHAHLRGTFFPPKVKQVFSRATSTGPAQNLLNTGDLPGHRLQRGSDPKVFN